MKGKKTKSRDGFEVCVVGGAGHVGLPLSIVFATKGRRTLIYDINKGVVDRVLAGEVPFMEEGAEPLLARALKTKKLSGTTDPSRLRGIPNLILTLGTPVDEFLNPDYKALSSCVDALVPYLSDDQLIILRSTVAPGVTAWLQNYLARKGKNPLIAFCPERVVQGRGISEIQSHPQIVSGITLEAEERAARLFQGIAPENVHVSVGEAEFVKLLSNVYRYLQFAITNQFYIFATRAGLDYSRILRGMKHKYHRMTDIPAAGFAAGPCLFKDTMQLAAFAENQFPLGFDAVAVNEGLPLFVVEELKRRQPLQDRTVGILGMAFKADNDDTRSSLSYKLKKLLSRSCREVLCSDPYVKSDPTLLPADKVVRRSDLLILGVPHSPYRKLNLRGKPIVDIWNLYGNGTGIPARF